MFFVIFWTALVRYTWLSNSSRFFFPTTSTFGCFVSMADLISSPTMRCGRLPSRSDVNINININIYIIIYIYMYNIMDSLSLLLKHAIKWRIASVIFWTTPCQSWRKSSPSLCGRGFQWLCLGESANFRSSFWRKFPTFGRKCRCGSDSTRSGAKENQEDVAAGTHKRGCD